MKREVVTLGIISLALMATVLVYVNVATAQVVTDGLISYWTLDDDDIDHKAVEDVWCGNGASVNDGTIKGDLKMVEGKIGEALEFNGEEGNYVAIPDDPSLNFGENGFTVEAWFDYFGGGNGGHACIVSKFDRAVGGGEFTCYMIFLPDKRTIGAKIRRSPDWKMIGSDIAPAGTGWHHVALTRDDDGTARLYVDMELIGSVSGLGWDIDNEGSLDIGARWGGRHDHFNGAIDNVRIYNRPLTQDEIEQNFSAKGEFISVTPRKKLATRWGEIKISK